MAWHAWNSAVQLGFRPISAQSLTVEAYKADRLPAGWNASDYEISQALGEKWLIAQKVVAMIVPSVLFPVEHNVVLNPSPPQAARILRGEPMEVTWDERLFVETKRRSV